MLIRRMAFSLLLSILLFSCSRPYLFICDYSFSELIEDRVQDFSSRPVILEVFSEKPGVREIVAAAGDKNAAGLIFSPLYYDLAQSVYLEDQGLALFAVVPPDYRGAEGIMAAEVNPRGAAEAVVGLVKRQIPGKDPVDITLIKLSEDTFWEGMIHQLDREYAGIRLQQITVSLEMVKQRDFGNPVEKQTDVLLLFIGEYGRDFAKNPGTDSRGVLPQMIISDRTVDSEEKIETYTLTIDWERTYWSLLNGIDEAASWILVSDSGDEEDYVP